MDLRCDAVKHAELNDGVIEVRCRSAFCRSPGTVVIHRFDAMTGESLGTRRYRDPLKEGSKHGIDNDPAAVRAP